MFILIMFMFFIMFLIRFFYTQKLEYEIEKDNFYIKLKDYEEWKNLEGKLKKMTPNQLDNLIIDCQEWLKKKKKFP
jgi:hypothetical protein